MKKDRLGEIFVKAGLIDTEKLTTVLEENKKVPRERLGDTLVRLNYTTEVDVAKALSLQYEIPYIDLTLADIDPKAVEKIPIKLAKQYNVFPISIEKKNLVLAMKDPLDLEAMDMVQYATGGMNIIPYIATGSDIEDSIRRYYFVEDSVDEIIKNVAHQKGFEFISDTLPKKEEVLDLKKKSELAPVIKLVNSIILQGITSRASDIHIEPKEKEILVRNRVDGILRDTMNMPKWLQGSVVSRIKIMASMDIAERRIPQDGAIKLKIENTVIDMRISTLPTQYGEKVVIRILETDRNTLKLTELGILPGEIGKINEMINLSQGMFFVCGPTGSGKTTTLYAIITEIARKQINIITVEDPIEYRVNKINQVQVNEKAGLTFAKTLRSILRQDPDVIFVGEIRDIETAEIAMRASITGHLVLSTIHTNDAVSTLTRLRDLGIDNYILASSILGIVSQRLVRKICNNCREEYDPPPETVKKIESIIGKELSFSWYHGKGCNLCQQSGYRGRIGIYEIFTMSVELRDLISRNASEIIVREMARNQGMRLLIEDGLEKMKQGITTIEELNRVAFVSEGIEDIGELKCNSCQRNVEPQWIVCPYCRNKLKEPQIQGTINITSPHEIIKHPEDKIGEGFKNYKILIVDDDEEIVQGLAFFLLKKQFVVATAFNGKEALMKITMDKPHLIVTDIFMPELDGLDLIKNLRQGITTAFIPIIILSQKKDVEDRLLGFETGADDYVPKPFSYGELFYRIQAVLRRTYR